jgi:Rrf2 family protein
MLSKTGLHATLALKMLADLPPGEYAGAVRIAREIGAPQNYLGKLLKSFAEDGLLESQKGFGGGFRLARPASRITLFDVIEPIEHVSRWNGCFLGRKKCNDKSPCAVHDRWSKVRDEYLQFLKQTTLTELAESNGKE